MTSLDADRRQIYLAGDGFASMQERQPIGVKNWRKKKSAQEKDQ